VRDHAADAAIGAVAGIAATFPMSGVMWLAQKAGLMGEQPPKRVTRWQARRLNIRPTQAQEDRSSFAAHLLFGALTGSGYGLVRPALPKELPEVPTGVLFGLAVWYLAYMGGLPALGIMPRADRDRPGRPQSMALAHIVYGGVLAALLRRRP